MDMPQIETIGLPSPIGMLGTWRRFGPVGPVYEVVATGRPLGGGDHLMRIRVLESGEELDYRLSNIWDDPREG